MLNKITKIIKKSKRRKEKLGDNYVMNNDLILIQKTKDKKICISCKYSTYDAVEEKGWNCCNKESEHYTNNYDLSLQEDCKFFKFAIPTMERIAKQIIKEEAAKAQTTLI